MQRVYIVIDATDVKDNIFNNIQLGLFHFDCKRIRLKISTRKYSFLNVVVNRNLTIEKAVSDKFLFRGL